MVLPITATEVSVPHRSSRRSLPLLRCLALAACLPLLAGQEPPAPPAPQPPPVVVEPAPPAGAEPAREPQGPGRRRGDRRAEGAGAETGQDPQRPAAAGEEGRAEEPRDDKPKEKRRGIPVADLLVQTHCARCHERSADGLMTRISFVRKSPEGWSEALKRMIRLHGLQLSPAEARLLVRSLADSHGLARSEAERSLYESERRVHWSEESHDQDLRETCAGCHTLGRVLAQQRDSEEWQQLRNTHVAMFPLARGQMGGGPPPDETEQPPRGDGGGAPPGGDAGGARRGGAPGATGAEAGPPRRGGSSERGDRVLQKLAATQPLFTPEWERWSTNRREVPLAGTWTVVGHEIGRGDLIGTATVVRLDVDEYEVQWDCTTSSGERLLRSGKALLYAGHSWRGRSTGTGADTRTWREVLLLDERWDTLRGRCFTGDYDEIGIDVALHRHRGLPRVLAVPRPWLTVPARDQVFELRGEAFPEAVAAADFQLGAGVTVKAVQRLDAARVLLTVDVAPGAVPGPRDVSYGAEPSRAQVQLYDAVDYVRIRPLQGLSRIGGTHYPKQIERYEAVAVHRGPDQKPFTADDVDLFAVDARWSLAESPVRDDDDDIRYVGSIDGSSGVFTPAVEGPNPQRKWSANNVGEVYVECTADLIVPRRAEKPPGDDEEPPTAGDPAFERRTFRARAHLLVTVPLYMRWNALEWEAR